MQGLMGDRRGQWFPWSHRDLSATQYGYWEPNSYQQLPHSPDYSFLMVILSHGICCIVFFRDGVASIKTDFYPSAWQVFPFLVLSHLTLY